MATPLRRLIFALIPVGLLATATELFCRRYDRSDAVESARIALDFDGNLMWGLSSRVPAPDYAPNADGVRGPELTAKPPGMVRILTLGDSSIYGDMVHYDSVFSSIVGRRLNAMEGPKVEVVDGGIPGYSSVQAIGMYAKLKAKVQPDIVIIGCLWSDAFPADQTDVEWAEELADTYAPWRPVTNLLTTMSSYSAAARVGRRAMHDVLLPGTPAVIKIGWLDYAPRTLPPAGLPGAPNSARPSVSADGGAPLGGGGVGVSAAPGTIAANGPDGGKDGGPKDGGPKDGGGRSGPRSEAEKKAMKAKAQEEGAMEPLPEWLVGPAARARTMRVPLDGYADNLATLSASVRADGALPVFLLLPHPADDFGGGVPLLGVSYRATMRDAAVRHDVPLIDGSVWFIDHSCGDCNRFADSIHPNEAGHGVIADAVEAMLLGDPEFLARLGRTSAAEGAAGPGAPAAAAGAAP